MKNFVITAVLLVVCLLFCSCASRKKVVSEQHTEAHTTENTFEKDSSVVEYLIDTTRLSDTEVVLTKTEYFPYFFTDSLTRTSKQPVKTVETALIRKTEAKKGETKRVETAVAVKTDSVKNDSYASAKTSTERTAQKSLPWWWLLVALLLAGFGYWNLRRK